ncbi:hypothetical protein DPMN_145849 [Dreissena polymorpha]|uniref:Uncharacterized protein n=1 Tax=Dreissena polymorpha TaxID=45954 RepID=A0A9D4F4U9_DREPO|nr:hypothetical protein DPMN_145849 [Dreissena polymorpha]
MHNNQRINNMQDNISHYATTLIQAGETTLTEAEETTLTEEEEVEVMYHTGDRVEEI